MIRTVLYKSSTTSAATRTAKRDMFLRGLWEEKCLKHTLHPFSPLLLISYLPKAGTGEINSNSEGNPCDLQSLCTREKLNTSFLCTATKEALFAKLLLRNAQRNPVNSGVGKPRFEHTFPRLKQTNEDGILFSSCFIWNPQTNLSIKSSCAPQGWVQGVWPICCSNYQDLSINSQIIQVWGVGDGKK